MATSINITDEFTEQEQKFKDTYKPTLQAIRDEQTCNARPVDYSFLEEKQKTNILTLGSFKYLKAAVILLVFFPP